MDFVVHGRDAKGVEDRLTRLANAHWDYMDRFARQLVARGPTLSADGEEHTGSVHVVSLANAAEARRFADEEPYARAGVYAEVSVTRFENLLGRTMWQRPPAKEPPFTTFLIARTSSVALAPSDVQALRASIRSRPDAWVFLGLLLSDDGTQCGGAIAAADVEPEAAQRALREVLAPLGLERAQIETSRWSRGGRN